MTGKDHQTVRRVRVWDLPIRVFHWALVLLIFGSWLTGAVLDSYLDWHMYIGVTIGGLVLFRLMWGLWGSDTARFTQFIRGPGGILDYLRGRGAIEGLRLGHNPLGALSVVALLGLLCVQVGTGLFAHDDAFTEGPFHEFVSSDTSDWLTAIHKQNFYVLFAFILLHVGAVFFHVLVKHQDLLRAMITGWMRIPSNLRLHRDSVRLRFGGWLVFVVTAAIAAAVAWWVAAQIVTL